MTASKARASRREGLRPKESMKPSHSLKLSKPKNGSMDLEINEHRLVQIKKTPEEVIALQKLLALPENRDLASSAAKGQSFEECLAILSADLGIMLDGMYDVAPLCLMLTKVISTRGGFNSGNIHISHPDLVPIRRLDTDDMVSVESRAEGLVSIKQATSGEGPYTICAPCNTSFECCSSRDCKRGKPAFQLGNSLDIAKKIMKGLN